MEIRLIRTGTLLAAVMANKSLFVVQASTPKEVLDVMPEAEPSIRLEYFTKRAAQNQVEVLGGDAEMREFKVEEMKEFLELIKGEDDHG